MKTNELIQIETKNDLAIVVDAELFRLEKGWTETPVVPVQTADGIIVSIVRVNESNYNAAFAWAEENECVYHLAQNLEIK